MEESEANLSSEDLGNVSSSLTQKPKPKKRSIVERELETSLTARVTSPVCSDGRLTSRYGRTRTLKGERGYNSTNVLADMKSTRSEKSPIKSQSPVYKMHASNSPIRVKKPTEAILENQIENIYQENISLSRFNTDDVTNPSPAKKFPKVYIRKDLIQKREAEETVVLIKNLFPPSKSAQKRPRDTHLNNILERSSERFNPSSSNKSVEKSSEKYRKPQNGYIDNSSVVKTLDFDSKRKKKDSKETKIVLSKSDLFDFEAKCEYQVGDLAWARMGTFPFWPCIITRDPVDGVFVRKKLFGRIERDIIHVTFFGDNGRRGWIVDTMLRKYLGQLEFETTREKFTVEDKKKDPRLYAAFFVSDKKQSLWNASVEEAEMLLREPKRLRIDIFNDMLEKTRIVKVKQRSSKVTRTDSDVSLSESLYDTLFSEDDGKSDSHDNSRRSRNKSLDVFDVVTACLDNMAAKSGITKIQKQSHMDRWLQKAKSKTPEKAQVPAPIFENNVKASSAKKKKRTPGEEVIPQKPYSLRRSGIESQNSSVSNEPDHNIDLTNDPIEDFGNEATFSESGSGIGIIAKVVSLRDKIQEGNVQEDTGLLIECTEIAQKETNTKEIDHDINNIKDRINSAESKGLNKPEDRTLYNKTIKETSNTDSIANLNDTENISMEILDENKVKKDSNNVLTLTEQKKTSIKNKISTNSLEEDGVIVNSDAENVENSTDSSRINQTNHQNDSNMDVDDKEPMKNNMDMNQTCASVDKKLNNFERSQEIDSNEKFHETPMKNGPSDSNEEKQIPMDVDESTDSIKVETDKDTEMTEESSETLIKSPSIASGIENIVSNELRYSSGNPKRISEDVDKSYNSILGIGDPTSNLIEQTDAELENRTQSTDIGENKDDEITSDVTCSKKDASFNNADMERTIVKTIGDKELNGEIKHALVSESNFINEVNESERKKSKCELSEDETSKIPKCNGTEIFDSNVKTNEHKISLEVKQEDKVDIEVSHYFKCQNPLNGEIETENKKTVFPKFEIRHMNTNLDEQSLALIQDKVQNSMSKTITSAVVCGNNIFIDDDSDDEPLPYSPLSVDLNKDDNADELNDVEPNFEENNEDEIASVNNISKLKNNSSPNDINLNKDVSDKFDESCKVDSKVKDNNDGDKYIVESVSNVEKPSIGVPETCEGKVSCNDTKCPLVDLNENKNVDDLYEGDANLEKKIENKKNTVSDDETTIQSDGINPRVLIVRMPIKPDKKSDCFDVSRHPKVILRRLSKDRVKTLYKSKNEDHDVKKRCSKEVKPIEISSSSANKTCKIVIEDHIISKSIVKPTLGENELQLNLHSGHNKDKALSNEDGVTNECVVDVNISATSESGTKNDVILNRNIVDNPRQKDVMSNENVVSVKPNNSDKRKLQSSSHVPLTNGYDSDKQVLPDSVKPLPINGPLTKENGYYDKRSVKDHIEIETIESATNSKLETKRKLRSMQEKKPENPLNNLEFVKYLELRQDSIMDENPDLCHEEIVAYLYKTWLYEENIKSDAKKTDDLHESNLVKGLSKESTRNRKRNLSIKRNNKINHSDTRNKCIENKETTPNKSDRSNYETTKQDLEVKQEVIENIMNSECEGVVQTNMEDVNIGKLNAESIVEDKSTTNNGEFIETVHDTLSGKFKIKEKGINESYKTSENSSSASINDDNNAQSSLANMPESTVNDSYSTGCLNTDISIQSREFKSEKIDMISEVSPSVFNQKDETHDADINLDTESVDSEDSEAPLINCKRRSIKKKDIIESYCKEVKKETDVSPVISEDAVAVTPKRKKFRTVDKMTEKSMSHPEFVKYLELRQDALIDENPQLTHDEILAYLYQTWLYEENTKSDLKKSDDIESSNLVKGLDNTVQPPKKVKRNKIKMEKEATDIDSSVKEKPKRKIGRACYNEEYSDIEEEIEYFEIFRNKNKERMDKDLKDIQRETVKVENCNGEQSISINDDIQSEKQISEVATEENQVEVYNEVEYYFWELTQPKPNVFKGLNREKICEICDMTTNLVKCKSCNGTFHADCVKQQTEVAAEVNNTPSRGRKKKKKAGRKPKSLDDSGNPDDGSEDLNASVEEIIETETHTFDAETLEAQLAAKMKELIDKSEIDYESYSSDDGIDWNDTVPGKCEIIEVKLKPRSPQIDYSNFKCHNCTKYETPICFVCNSAASKTENLVRQKCHVAHCQKYYHLECLDHWPQTQFNGGEPSRTNKKINEYFEALTCPRHVCHTCVSDDPRGCKTRFSGDKLARCAKCPATYHSFSKCLPAGTQILTASYIICPRHHDNRQGKVPYHVNTGWCFLCAQGGSLICCEYCPTSFHAECLNIKPPEGGYMCEDCETGRLPLYGEMVWVKLGHYRWWPGLILHPSQIPDNIMAVKHSPGEFVVRFFGQYDHYWVNRGRVFPFQEGDSGRISSQKSKIDAAFTMAIEHAYRACEILKTAPPNEEESLDIASSLLPPHYVKLKVNKPCGSLCGRKVEDPESSLTQCECNPLDEDPCGPYSLCINRMLLTECGPICRAGDRCNNRAFEKRLYPKLTPYRTPSRGWGLKTLENIKAGQFVIEYVGELIDEEEFRRRMRRMHEMRDENFYFLTLDKERMIDAGPKGNLARFMNHCCEPNCETQKWTVLGDVRVGLFAIHDIPANSEVTFNYNLECAGIDKKKCMCGAKRCSGYIGAKPKQDDLKKNKLPKRQYNKKKKPEDTVTLAKPKRPLGRPRKQKELTEIEKDVLLIKNATTTSSDESRSLSTDNENPRPLKRKNVSLSTEDAELCDGTESVSAKRKKMDVDNPVGD